MWGYIKWPLIYIFYNHIKCFVGLILEKMQTARGKNLIEVCFSDYDFSCKPSSKGFY